MNKIKYLPFYVISLIPIKLLYLLSDFLFVLVFHVLNYRRKIVRQNLINSFPDKNITIINKIEKKFYKHFCDIIIELLYTLTLKKEHSKKRIIIKNIEFLNEYYYKKRNIILYCGHIGNWEWMSLLPNITNYTINALYQPLTNKYTNDLLKYIRSRSGMNCIKSDMGFKHMIKLNNSDKLNLNVIVGDQSPTIYSQKYWTNFLNQDTAFFVGVERISKYTNQVIIYPHLKKIKRGFYEIEFKLIDENPQKSTDIISKFSNLLELNIKESPELWLWSHRRWKLKKSS